MPFPIRLVRTFAKEKDGLPILSGKSEFYGKNIIPKLKEKFPKLFSDIKNDKLGRGKIYIFLFFVLFGIEKYLG